MVKEAKGFDNTKLLITFTNNKQKIFDLKPYANKSNLFRNIISTGRIDDFNIIAGSIFWNDDACLSYDTLYIDSIECHSEIGVTK